MSKRSEDMDILKKRAAEIKKEFEDEINRILYDINDGKQESFPGMFRGETDEEPANLEDYEKRLEGLKEELKRLKKIKKQQKKISKLEEEKVDVLREIERKKIRDKKLQGHKKH